MKTAVALLLAALSILAFTQPAPAREWRGCSATILISGHGTAGPVWNFGGRGSCRSRVYANDCRRAARGAIMWCLDQAWATRWQRVIPGACRPISGSNRPFVHGIYDTSFGRGRGAEGDQDFKWAVERTACCHLFRDRDRVTFAVRGMSIGDNGCQGNVVLEPAYRVGCARFRARGFCS